MGDLFLTAPDRVAFIQPFITPAVKKLVSDRLARHVALVEKDQALSAKQKIDIKIALLVVHIINPFEEFFAPEEALIRGVHWQTLAKRKASKEIDRGRLR